MVGNDCCTVLDPPPDRCGSASHAQAVINLAIGARPLPALSEECVQRNTSCCRGTQTISPVITSCKIHLPSEGMDEGSRSGRSLVARRTNPLLPSTQIRRVGQIRRRILELKRVMRSRALKAI
ncbi:uncharacterized [Tachysurus ichikawai]